MFAYFALSDRGKQVAFFGMIILIGARLRTEAAIELYVSGMQVGRYQHAGRLITAGNIELRKGKLETARGYYEAAIHEQPTFWPGYLARSGVYLSQGKWELAKEDANKVLHLDSTVHEAELLRAHANKGMGDCAAFLHDVDSVIRLWSLRDLHHALNTRAWFRATWPDPKWRDGRQAVQDAKWACNLTSWKKVYIIDTLAAACAECGDFDSAVRYEDQALRGVTDAAAAKEYAARADLYRQHRPVRSK